MAARSALQSAIQLNSGLRVSLTLTDNTSTMMSVKYDRARTSARLRLHHMFLSAPAEVVRALAIWVRSPRAPKAGALLNAYIKANEHRIVSTRKVTIETKGEHFDLKAIFDDVNSSHFRGTITSTITWGRIPEARRRRTIRFGSYYAREDIIRIHPFLDQGFVPYYFIRYVVFHEMLHACLGVEATPSGRQRVHTADFRNLEQAYPDYAKAMAWENNPKNLGRLLSRKSYFARFFEGIRSTASSVAS